MLIVALISTVALLVWMGFFMMGSLPLLILKHDTPLDSRFIRGLFNVYYLAVMATAGVGALSYALAGRPLIALALGCVADPQAARCEPLRPHELPCSQPQQRASPSVARTTCMTANVGHERRLEASEACRKTSA
jgi:hypothetical protein